MRGKFGSSFFATLAVVFVSRTVSAQSIEAPRLVGTIDAVYPVGAHGDAVAVLDVVVGRDGSVTNVRVLAAGVPFIENAVDAARRLTFDPARRDGITTAARVRVEIPFVEPHIPQNRPLKKAPSRAVVEDVHVQGSKREPTAIGLSHEETRNMPGAFGDAFRAIDMMPGVVPIASGVPFFFVRGAPPGNTGYFLDGIRVPLLFHLALGPSVVHPSLIDHVDFFPGNAPVEDGRFTGGVVSGVTREPSPSRHGEANVRAFDAGVLGETPFAGGKGEALVSGRFGYPGLLLPLFAPDDQLAYWDYQARVSYRVSPHDVLSAFVFGSFDELDQRDHQKLDNGEVLTSDFYPVFRTEFHRADLRWDHALPHGSVRTAVTVGLDDSLEGFPKQNRRVRAQNVEARARLDERLSTNVRFRTGADAVYQHYEYGGSEKIDTGDGLETTITLSFPPRDDVMVGAWAEVVWRPHPRIEIVPGLRADVFSSSPETAAKDASFALASSRSAIAMSLDPRITARVSVTDRFTWIGALGVTHQPPSFVVPVPGGDLGTLANGLQASLQASQGFEAKLPSGVTLQSTIFAHEYFSINDALATCTSVYNSALDAACLDQRTRARAFGVEVLLRRSFTKRVAGWISYTFSRSSVEVPSPPPGQQTWAPSSFDRPNVLNAALSVDLGKGWRAGARFTYYTGLPYSQMQSGTALAPIDGYRLPDFWRIDARLEKRFRLGAHGTLSIVLEGINITLNQEAIGVQCTPVEGHLDTCTPQIIGPISVPSLGLEAMY